MDHQPAPVPTDEEVCGCGLSRVKARVVKYGNILGAGDPGEAAFYLYGYVGGLHAHFLPALEYPHPALAHSRPAGDQIPSRMHTPDPVFVRPQLFQAFYLLCFQRSIKRKVDRFDFLPVLYAHTPGKTIPQAAKNSSQYLT